jgi:predicted phage-related endonuclease
VPLEAKLTGAFGRDWDSGVPEYFMPQVQQQMLVTGAPMASFACLINGTKLVHADVERDESMIAEITEAGERFWRAVKDRSAPPPDGSKSAGWALTQLYGKDDGRVVDLDWESEELTRLHDKLADDIKRMKQESERICQAIQQRMGSATVAVLPGVAGAWTWKLQQRAEYTVKATEFRVMRRKKLKEKNA